MQEKIIDFHTHAFGDELAPKAMKLYVNGDLQGSGTFEYDTGTTVPQKALTIGARSYDSTIADFFGGLIDEVLVFGSALTDDQIECLAGLGYRFITPGQQEDGGNPYRFTGREYDTETGNYYYRARYYKSSIGRFLQTDPVYYSDGLNLYTYCGNNPINRVDPYGLSFRDWWDSFVEWLRAMTEAMCPPVTGGIVCSEGSVTCLAYRRALDRAIKDPSTIDDDEYRRLKHIGETPGIKPRAPRKKR